MENYPCPFKIGDRVIITEPSELSKIDPPYWTYDMDPYIGHTGTVECIDNRADDDENELDGYTVKLSNSTYWWRDTWLQHVHDYTLF